MASAMIHLLLLSLGGYNLKKEFFRQDLQDYQDFFQPFAGSERPNPIAYGEH
jgi:hypothetical protein